MYITADGESVLEDAPHSTGSGQDTFAPKSIESVDVKKTGLLYTKTPDTLKTGPEGRERLLTFLDKVEANIAKEVESRKADIAAIRAQMAKNMAYNAEARATMKKMLLAKMAVNAKKAKEDLAEAMRQTQAKFAAVARLENKRQRQTIRRSKKTREIMRKNKAEGAKNLKNAVTAQQRALATLAQATNERIKSTNKHIAVNAAQIKENAKKARKDLDNAMSAFDNKMANVSEEAQKGRSKLAAQAAAQDKKFREYANNRIKAITAKTAAQFHKVRDTMAKDRAAADAALSHTSARMDAALNAAAALQDKRFAQTVSDIAEAKKEANDRVEKFRTGFKTDILHLSGVVEEQSNKLNSRVTQLAGTVESNKAEQAHLNAQVDAELKRMVKVGNDRYDEHLKKDSELKALMAKNKDANEKAMNDMSQKFYAQLADIKAQMKKDRAHAEHSLSTNTGALFKTLADNQEAQDAVNKELTEATRRAKLDAEAALKEAKEGFTSKVAKLHEVVKTNEKKHNAKVEELTGVVAANAIKDAEGRAELKKISNFNKNTMKKAVADAVHQGEQRALQIEKKMTDINAKTRTSMNNRITSEISTLSKSIHSQIDELNLQTKEARAQMKEEIQFALTSAAKFAKDDLKKAIAWSEGEFSKLNANLASEKKLSEGERAKMTEQVAADKANIIAHVNDAVSAQNAALLALKQETNHEIKKTNKALDAQAEIMIENAQSVREEMKANTAAIVSSLEAARKAADEQLASVNAASEARYNEVVKAVEDGVDSAMKHADEKFSEAYIQMATNRKHFGEELASGYDKLNDSIAKLAALEDERFSKTVKDIGAARKEASDQVAAARKHMKSAIVATTATAKQTESRIIGSIQEVSAMVVSDKAAQIRINESVDGELKRILSKSNDYETKNVGARGIIRKIMDENKQAAAQEVQELAQEAEADLKKLRSQQAGTLLQFKQDLTGATESVYEKLAKDNKAQQAALSGLKGNLAEATATTKASLADSKAVFASRVITLENAITANAKHFEDGLTHLTGVTMDWKEAAQSDRANIRMMRDGMVADLNKNIARAIQLGEAKIKAVEEEANLNIATERKSLLTTISASVENMADNVFKVTQENRQKIADNYLSLKAYASTAADKIVDYLEKGKGRNLSSVGDLLQTVAGLSDVKTKPAEGMGFGGDTLPMIFSGKTVKVDGAVSKINGLVDEYIATLGQVKERWPLGLGKYLLAKLEIAMSKAGALEVDKIEGKSGNYVFMNAHAVGLSSKLSDFEGLAVRMAGYESTLAKMTGHLSGKKTAGEKTANVPPPEWQGN
jgi:hypothetical protein